jgi:hypothetical protein
MRHDDSFQKWRLGDYVSPASAQHIVNNKSFSGLLNRSASFLWHQSSA